MANRRQKQLMQESLDERLPLEARQELFRHLDAAPDDAASYQRLRDVDRLLRGAPYARAPKALALTIMARLVEGLQPQMLSHISGLALAVALALVAALMIPLLVGISWLFLSAVGSAAALAALMETIVRLLALVVTGVESLVQGAQSVLAAYPHTPALILALFPAVGVWLGRSAAASRAPETVS